jgi:protein-tyrosine kinase
MTIQAPSVAPGDLELLAGPSGAAAPAMDGSIPDAEDDVQVQYRLSRRLICLSDPAGERAESIRALRAHLIAGHLADGRRSLAICGAGSNAGTTFLSVNLAVALAQAGIETLLVDANMHSPGVSHYLVPDRNLPGLRDILDSGDPQSIDAIQREVLPNLSVLQSGSPGPTSNELLASRKFKQLIDDCMRDHEITIVDTPSGRSMADVRRIAKSVRYALIVARKDHTLMSEVRTLVEELDADRVNLVGTFLTDF